MTLARVIQLRLFYTDIGQDTSILTKPLFTQYNAWATKDFLGQPDKSKMLRRGWRQSLHLRGLAIPLLLAANVIYRYDNQFGLVWN